MKRAWKVRNRYARAKSLAFCLFKVDRQASNGTSDSFGKNGDC
jgi:hypothetical protein